MSVSLALIKGYLNDHFIPNPDDRYSYSKTTVEREDNEHWIVRVSPKPQEKNWLPTGNEPGELVLMLRCYNPGVEMKNNPGTISLPTIVREDAS